MHEENSMMNHVLELTPDELNLAFQCLSKEQPPPKELHHLILQDWLDLSRILNHLLQEKEQSLLH
jgi:hypothetical protein